MTTTTTRPNPHPTPTRLDLLRNIDRRTVRREYPDRHPEYDYDFRAGRRVCARIAEAQAAGWVALDETRFSTGVHGVVVSYWRLTDAGRAVLAADTTPTRSHRDEPPLHRPVTTVHLPAADIA